MLPRTRCRAASQAALNCHARTARSRNRAPRPCARDGGRALRRRWRRAAATCAGRCRRISPQRLEGKTVDGLGRRAKYLLADLSSGDVLLMHLGMSGSFRVVRDGDASDARPVPSRARASTARTTTSCSTCRTGAAVTFNDPRRFGLMKLVPRAELDQEPLLRALGPEPLGNAFDAAHAGAGLRRQEDQPEGGAARPARRRRARQHLCLRGAASRAAVAQARAPRPSRRDRARRNERAERLVDAIKAVLNDAIEAGGSSLRDHRRTDGELGYFQHNFRVYDREGEPCPTPGCTRHDPAHRADRALDVLLPGVPEVSE